MTLQRIHKEVLHWYGLNQLDTGCRTMVYTWARRTFVELAYELSPQASQSTITVFTGARNRSRRDTPHREAWTVKPPWVAITYNAIRSQLVLER